MSSFQPPADDADLDRLLRNQRLGPPDPGDVTPWDFARVWPADYLEERVWPLVSHMLEDGDVELRARAIEFTDEKTRTDEQAAARLLEVAEQRPELFGDGVSGETSLRHLMTGALANGASELDGPRVARAIWKIGADEPMWRGPASVVARFFPAKMAEHARRWGAKALDAISSAAETIARLRRDDIIDYLQALRALPPEQREAICALVDHAIYRDDAQAALAVTPHGMAPPVNPAPSTAACRRAIGLQ